MARQSAALRSVPDRAGPGRLGWLVRGLYLRNWGRVWGRIWLSRRANAWAPNSRRVLGRLLATARVARSRSDEQRSRGRVCKRWDTYPHTHRTGLALWASCCAARNEWHHSHRTPARTHTAQHERTGPHSAPDAAEADRIRTGNERLETAWSSKARGMQDQRNPRPGTASTMGPSRPARSRHQRPDRPAISFLRRHRVLLPELASGRRDRARRHPPRCPASTSAPDEASGGTSRLLPGTGRQRQRARSPHTRRMAACRRRQRSPAALRRALTSPGHHPPVTATDHKSHSKRWGPPMPKSCTLVASASATSTASRVLLTTSGTPGPGRR
jgi:hypothetical protein